jgi:hypothetical protein
MSAVERACPARTFQYVDFVTTSSSKNSQTPIEALPSADARRSWWRLPFLLSLVLVAILLYRGFAARQEIVERRGSQASSQPDSPTADRVSISVDFGGKNGARSSTVRWKAGITVRDLLAAASVGEIGQQGSGAAAFLTQIDGVKNEGAGGRNWMYSVNGQRADRSFAVYKLQPGDRVLWSFAPPQ